VPLAEPSESDASLLKAAKRGVTVHGIVYENVGLVSSMNSEHTCKALRDLNDELDGQPMVHMMRHPDHGIHEIHQFYWSHHDKAVIIDGSMVFWGGLDSCLGRWDYNVHPLADVHRDIEHELWVGQDYNNARILDFEDVKDWKQNMLLRAE